MRSKRHAIFQSKTKRFSEMLLMGCQFSNKFKMVLYIILKNACFSPVCSSWYTKL